MRPTLMLLFSLLLLSIQQTPDPESGKVLLVRATGAQQSARVCQVMQGENRLANLSNQEAVLLELPAGNQMLQTRIKKGTVLGSSILVHPGAYSFYELKLYKSRGLLPSSGYRFRIVPLSPKRLYVFLRDEDWLRRDLGAEEYAQLCRMLKVEPAVGRKDAY
ncbi:MAG: hypothetical protein AAGN35_00455 [Bacteroidota bacterium]